MVMNQKESDERLPSQRGGKKSRGKIKKTLPFTVASERTKYLEANVTKDVRDVWTENHKIMLKEMKEDQNKGKDIHIHGLENSIMLRWPYSPN